MKLLQTTLIFLILKVSFNWTFSTSLTPSGNDKIYCLDYSYDGTKLVVGGQARKVVIYETTTYSQIGIYSASQIPISIKFSPNGNFIVVGYEVDSADILSGTSYTRIQTLATGHSKVHDIDFLEDSSEMMTCGDDKKYRKWNTASWTQTYSSSDLSQVLWKCTYASEGSYAIGLDPGQVRIYNSANVLQSTYSPSASGKPYGVDFKYGTLDFIMGSDNSKAYTSASSSPILSGGGIFHEAKYARTTQYFMFAGEDYDVYIYDSTNALKYTMTEPNNKIYCGDFTNDGCSLAVGSEDNKFYIYTSVLGSCAPAAPPSTPSTPTTDNSTNCSIFTMDVKGCAICYNETFCHECSVGYYVEPDGLCYTCSEAITGCAVCNESTVCISCSPGFYLDGVTCKTCQSSLSGCLLCNDSSICIQCHNDFYLDTGTNDCQTCTQISNCLKCSSNTDCIQCVIGFYSDNTNTCQVCSSNCLACQEIDNCSACALGYYVSGGYCVTCSSMCLACNSSDFCLDCAEGTFIDGSGTCTDCPNNCSTCTSSGCQNCLTGYLSGGVCVHCPTGCTDCSGSSTCESCQLGYTLVGSTCTICDNLIDGCFLCDGSASCTNCLGGYYVDSGSCTTCESSMEGCEVCSDGSTCTGCKSGYNLNGVSCETCSSNLPGCLSCDSPSVCSDCQAGYFVNSSSNGCSLCSNQISGCTLCNGSSCLQCQSGYYTDNSGSCSACSSSLEGCSMCSDDMNCQECKGGYYLNSSACYPCSSLTGCSFCTDMSSCLVCEVTFYKHQGGCESCSQIPNCFHCSSGSSCSICNNGYQVSASGGCEVLQVSVDFPTSTTDQEQVEPMSLTLKTYYVSQYQLKHILYVRGTYFNHVDAALETKTTMFLLNPDGELIPLTIDRIQWGDNGYTLIYYTNNPYKISIEDIAKMNFTRRLLSESLVQDYRTQIDMEEAALKQVLPNYSHSGNLKLQYALNKPEFVATVVQGINNYSYHVFGIIIVAILFFKYLIKSLFTVPKSVDQGQITSHILALKTGVLILFPTYVEYYDYCSGFMVADFPWANSDIGAAVSNQSDSQPFSYGIFFTNMNFASMYLIAFSVFLFLALIVFLVFKKISDEDRKKSSFQFLYCFFIFGLTFAGSSSLQGAILNPLNEITGNACFYILGIFVYLGIVIECSYYLFFKKSILHLWKIRILIKATLLSLAHLNPVFTVSMLIFIDIALVVLEFVTVKSKPKLSYIYQYPKLWMIDNILCDVALGILILLPIILLSLVIISIIVVYVICSQFFIHYNQYKQKQKIAEEKQEKQEKKGVNHTQDGIKNTQESPYSPQKDKDVNFSNILFVEEPVNGFEPDKSYTDEKLSNFMAERKLKKKRAKKKQVRDIEQDHQNDVIYLDADQIKE